MSTAWCCTAIKLLETGPDYLFQLTLNGGISEVIDLKCMYSKKLVVNCSATVLAIK